MTEEMTKSNFTKNIDDDLGKMASSRPLIPAEDAACLSCHLNIIMESVCTTFSII
jgi:hypothetical protein